MHAKKEEGERKEMKETRGLATRHELKSYGSVDERDEGSFTVHSRRTRVAENGRETRRDATRNDVK